MVENGLWQSLTSEQVNKGQVVEMTKRWSPIINRRYFCRHGCPCKRPRGWGTHSSLPWAWWLPCRMLTRLAWVVPISWLPIRTLTRLVWVPFSPSRRWGWSIPGPGWLLPSTRVPLLVFIFRNLLLLGFLDLVLSGLPLLGWSSTIILERQHGHKNGEIQGKICWSYPKIFVLELQNSSGSKSRGTIMGLLTSSGSG